MTDIERLEERLSAVERAVIDGEHDLDELADLAELVDRLDRLESRLGEVEGRVADLEGRTDSMQGYVTNVDSVNESVEKQSAAALAAVESIEQRVDSLERRVTTGDGGADQQTAAPETESESVEDDPLSETVDKLVEGTDRDRYPGPGRSGTDRDSPEQTGNESGDAPTHSSEQTASDGQYADESKQRTDAADSLDRYRPTARPHTSGLPIEADSITETVDEIVDGTDSGSRSVSSASSVPEADPNDINRRYGSRPSPVPERSDPAESDETDDPGKTGDGLLASLASKLP